MFFNEVFAGLHFHWVEQVDFGDLEGQVRVKFNGMVIETVGRELVVSFH